MSRKSWNRGLTKETDERVAKNARSLEGHIVSEETREKISVAIKGRLFSEEHKEKIGAAKKGQPLSEGHKRKIGLSNQGKVRGKEHKDRYRTAARKRQKRLWQDPVYRKSQIGAIFSGHKLLPNKPEKILDKVLQELFPNQWKFVGDGGLWVISNEKCLNPDFVSANGQKKIIEVFGDYWHGVSRTGISNELHEQQRIDCFAHAGYQTLIVWQHEFEDIELLNKKLIEFCS